MKEKYQWLTKIDSLKLENKSVLIIGGGEMVKQYINCLRKLKVRDITVISKTGSSISSFCNQIGIKILTGGFENEISSINKKDLVIIATPITLTIKALESSLKNGQSNILVEKPASLYYKPLLEFSKKVKSQTIRIGYNRLVYPNFHRLIQLVKQDGGVTSCRFTFTEWLDRIDFKKDNPQVYSRWGICNSLHVISMAFELIGLPKKINSNQYGKLPWHKSGSVFIGNGITTKNIPFVYHADWGSGGRWGIEINTKKNSYILTPLEELFVTPKYSGKTKQIKFKKAFPELKQGLAEEIAIMLDEKNKEKSELLSLKEGAEYIKIAEKIFGYK